MDEISYEKFKLRYPKNLKIPLTLSIRQQAKKFWKDVKKSSSSSSFAAVYFDGAIFLTKPLREKLEELYKSKIDHIHTDFYQELIPVLPSSSSSSSSSISSKSISTNLDSSHSTLNSIGASPWLPFVGGLALGAAGGYLASRPYRQPYRGYYSRSYYPVWSYPYGGYYGGYYPYTPVFIHGNVQHHPIGASISMENTIEFEKRILSTISNNIGGAIDGCCNPITHFSNLCTNIFPRDCHQSRTRPVGVCKTICRPRCPGLFTCLGMKNIDCQCNNYCEFYPPEYLPWYTYDVHNSNYIN
jgi:hypothetical protein